MEALKIADNWLLTALVWGGSLAVLAVVLYYRAPISKFFGEVKAELQKCSWPWNPEQTGLRRYKELIDSTVVVLVSTILLATYVSVFDFLLSHLVRLVVRF
ncbi:MAG: preprotein translocase subunit SecE [bacterium]